jgi:hypothetical protein
LVYYHAVHADTHLHGSSVRQGAHPLNRVVT